MKLPNSSAEPEFKDSERLLDYNRYATQFDRMCQITPVYQDNIELLLKFLPTFNLPENATICDLGAGTGNFILAMARVLSLAKYIHLDFDEAMNNHAKAKYENAGLENVEVQQEHIQRAQFEESSLDLVVCVNALNTAAPQLPVLKLIRSWLKPTGSLFLLDFGREQRVVDWTWYIVKHLYQTEGIGEVFRSFWMNREAIRQNRRARLDQKAGRMWTHSTEEFSDLVEKAGFQVNHVQTCYRDYGDLVVAQK